MINIYIYTYTMVVGATGGGAAAAAFAGGVVAAAAAAAAAVVVVVVVVVAAADVVVPLSPDCPVRIVLCEYVYNRKGVDIMQVQDR